MRDARYSLWLVPDEETTEYRLLQDLIEDYSESYNTPAFKPHVTLIGGLESGVEVAEEIARDLEPFDITLFRPHFSSTKTQCFFLLAEPTAELMKLNMEAAEAGGKQPGMYLPHLSLLYGNLSFKERERLVESFDTEKLPMTFTATKLEVVKMIGTAEDWDSVEGFVESWEIVDNHSLG